MTARQDPVYAAPHGFSGEFLTDHRSRSTYSEGAGPYRVVPDAVALPRTPDDVAALVRMATRRRWALVPRGAGSGIPGGNVGRGVIVDLQHLREPITVADGRARVGAAATWRELDSVAHPHGLRLPPDPSSSAYCTIGGMTATNAAGARSLRHGAMRRWVEAIEIVVGDGEMVRLARSDPSTSAGSALEARFTTVAEPEIRSAASLIRRRFPRTSKNSAGYALDAYLDSGSLVDLVVGSEGTLGVITAIDVRLAPRPSAVACLLVGLPGLAELAEAVQRLLPLQPAALELLDRSFLHLAERHTPFPVAGWQAALLLDFEGSEIEVAALAEDAERTISDLTAFTRRTAEQQEREQLWSLRHAASPTLAGLPDTRRSLQVIEDGCVPLSQLGPYLRGVHAAAAEARIEVVAFGHAGDGHLHVNALVDTTETGFESRLASLLDRVTALVLELGGTPSGEHGDGRLRVGAVTALYGERIVDVFRSVKRAFDPAGILNPGVIIRADGVALPAFKVGPEAAAIPADVAGRLRQVERSAGWAVPKLELLRDPVPR
ncbi:MAG: FAD-binding oxidoreductase [Gemmatimonadales bacterium]|nr:FAD-binding oxidoreductase [Gemmatimonadales bacterium]